MIALMPSLSDAAIVGGGLVACCCWTMKGFLLTALSYNKESFACTVY